MLRIQDTVNGLVEARPSNLARNPRLKPLGNTVTEQRNLLAFCVQI